MKLSRNGRITVSLFLLALLGSVFFRWILMPLVLVHFFTQNYCAGLVIVWAITIKRRIIDKRQRNLILIIAFNMILLNLFQISRYRLVGEAVDYCRWLWYLYYVPIILIPAFIFTLARFVHLPEEKNFPKVCAFMIALGTGLAGLVALNDYHGLVFHFTDLEMEQYTRGFLYYGIIIFIAVCYFSCYHVLLHKAKRSNLGFLRLLPVSALFALLIFSVLDAVGLSPRIGPYRLPLWNFGEFFCFCNAFFVEGCIQIGLIPANSDYDEMFQNIHFYAEIKDQKGQTAYLSAAKKQENPEKYPVSFGEYPVQGGSVCWETDLSNLVKLEHELEAENERLKARMDYLQQENRIQEEQTRVQTQNTLYDRITHLVMPQIQKIDLLLSNGEQLQDKLPTCAVLITYIKRCSNMILTAQEGRLSSDELTMAVYETMENLKLCGVSASSNAVGSAEYDAQLVIEAYAYLETLIENGLESLDSILVILMNKPEHLSLRLMIKAESWSMDASMNTAELLAYQPKLSVSKEKDEILLSLELSEGRAL